jgi:ABC-type bacteriocin/lantibiotic exporter with double-glycine peptidase domain
LKPSRVLARLALLLALVSTLVIVVPSAIQRASTGRTRVWDPGRSGVLLGTSGMVLQRSDRDCGIAAVAMVLAQYGRSTTYEQLLEDAGPEPALTSMATLQRLMTAHGVPADGLRGSGPSRRSWPGPWIAHFRESHWVVVERHEGNSLVVADPRFGRIALPAAAFDRRWSGYALVPVASQQPARN